MKFKVNDIVKVMDSADSDSLHSDVLRGERGRICEVDAKYSSYKVWIGNYDEFYWIAERHLELLEAAGATHADRREIIETACHDIGSKLSDEELSIAAFREMTCDDCPIAEFCAEDPCNSCRKAVLHYLQGKPKEQEEEPAPEEQEEEPILKEDKHYQGKVQPIKLMESQMTPVEFMAFLRGNIIKYCSRFGKKENADIVDEARKIQKYAEWLHEAAKGEEITL